MEVCGGPRKPRAMRQQALRGQCTEPFPAKASSRARGAPAATREFRTSAAVEGKHYGATRPIMVLRRTYTISGGEQFACNPTRRGDAPRSSC
jgi:hypothetical protein